ncbi:alpha/beta fold hydrolase [Streptomyces sp. NPDC057236]|uniref:alpha/beta fold hydrolase n=1 Tax=Streptomyces sp. NPDC057236 TaxID=3346059 RepID=UPI003628331F
MSTAHARLHHDLSGPLDGPLLVLGPSLGTSMALWEPHVASLAEKFRVLRYDLPGHGGSPAEVLGEPLPGRTTVAELAGLVRTLVDEQGRETFAYAGISLGGAIGAQLAVEHPGRVTALALICTSAHFGGRQAWLERAGLVRREGVAPLVKSSPARWFAGPDTADSKVGRGLLHGLAEVDPAGYAACCDALAQFDVRDRLRSIEAPTWVIGGERDVATPVEHARELAEGIRGAGLRIADCAHLALEDPNAVQEVLGAVHREVSGTGLYDSAVPATAE